MRQPTPTSTLFPYTTLFRSVAKAMELGELRHSQGFDAYELLKEYELFGGILFAFMTRTVDEIDQPCTRGELLRSEEHTSELQSHVNLVCRLLLEKKNNSQNS